MKKTTDNIFKISGVEASEYFGTVIGPIAAAVMEMNLTKYLASGGEGMTGPELKMVQFAVEIAYGKAVNRTEVTRKTDQEVAADQIKGLDPDTLRKIASANAPRLDS